MAFNLQQKQIRFVLCCISDLSLAYDILVFEFSDIVTWIFACVVTRVPLYVLFYESLLWQYDKIISQMTVYILSTGTSSIYSKTGGSKYRQACSKSLLASEQRRCNLSSGGSVAIGNSPKFASDHNVSKTSLKAQSSV